jgi:5-methylcytosine-specific restriction endonuclease McrA
MRGDGLRYPEHSRCVREDWLTLAECVDHIDGHDRPDDRETFYDASRLQSLCMDCNRRKAIMHEGGFGRAKTRDSNATANDSSQNPFGGKDLEPHVG